MAANMQHMAGAGQMMPQQMRRQVNGQLHNIVYENLVANPPPANMVITWQGGINMNERLSKIMTLITNITLAVPNIDRGRALEFACTFERENFIKQPTKESYDQALQNKTLEFVKKRQANEPNIQNALNANIQQLQAQQNMMNMQAQMGRGMNQGAQQPFQHLQHQMQPSQMPQQPQPNPQQAQLQQQQQQQQQQMTQQQMTQQQMMGIGMGMGNQAGRGVGLNQQQQQQMMGMMGAQNRQAQAMPNEFSRLANADKTKVAELAAKLLSQATEQQKATARHQMQTKLPPQQLAEFQATGKDPLLLYYQYHAHNLLKNSANRLQTPAGQQMQNPNQAAMMQAQQSQQSMQQRSNMMNGAQQNGQQNAFGGDPSQFAPNMDSIKDQQMNGFMAQQAGQMVVPASQGGPRTSTPHSMNQNIPNQQGQNQPGRPNQPQQTPQQQPQQHQNMNAQQASMNQTAQQTQAQLQAQMRQMQGQQAGMAGGMVGGMPGGMANGMGNGMVATQQSPGMNTLNTPVSRAPNNMNGMGPQGAGQGAVAFGDQRFNQGIQRPNNQAFNTMLANMSQEQRAAMNAMPPDKLQEVLRKWQTSRQAQMNMDAGNQMNPNQAQNRPQNQFGQMPGNMVGPTPPGMQQPGAPGPGNQNQQIQTPRGPMQNAQAQAMMDSMDLPPQVMNQIGGLPESVKKWRDLKVWAASNNLAPNAQRQLGVVQHKQFQILMARRGQQQQQQQQAGQNPNMNNGMQGPATAMPQQQPGMPRPMGNMPPQIFQVTPQEMVHLRTRQQFAHMTDEQLRQTIISIKRTNWQQQQMRQQQGMQQQAGMPNQMLPVGQNQMAPNQAPMPMTQPPQQPTPTQVPRTQAPAANVMSQTASMQRQPSAKKQQAPAAEQPRNKRQKSTSTTAQAPTPSPAQPAAKNLKRPSTDDTAEASSSAEPAAPSIPVPNQQGVKTLTPQQIAKLSPEKRAQYEKYIKTQMASASKPQPAGNQNQTSPEHLARLKEIGQQELKLFSKEVMPELPMSPEEHSETIQKLQRIVIDMSKIGRGLSKWYAITRDDARAKAFFRTRLRFMRQFVDGEHMNVPKDVLSIRSDEIDAARKMFESMAKDLAASVYGRNMKKPQPQGASQDQATLQQQQQAQAAPGQLNQQAQPAPLNAANLEKNAQALNKMNQQKAANKGAQGAAAGASTAQQTFHISGTSPHGNPNYIGKAKDMQLHLPPARNKRQKTSNQQTQQGSSTSPQSKKMASPEMQRATEPAVATKPLILCKEPECATSTTGYPSEQELQQHIDEEHIKPKEDPVKYVQESLALALGLEPDGSVKKEIKQPDGAQPMSATTSKQGLTPGNLGATPKSQDAAMKRSASAMSKDKLAGKANIAAKAGDAKQAETKDTQNTADPWASVSIDPAALLNNLGYENGIPGIISDVHLFRTISPQEDTPESAKDSGTSEPNSDLSEGVNLDIDLEWQMLEPDLLLNLNNTSLEGDLSAFDGAGTTLDPSLLMNPSAPAPTDWDDVNIDFSKPFQLDTSFYQMQT